jgi:hypothetical protein
MSVLEQECDCDQAKAQLDAFRRGELDTNAVVALCRHLERCRHCKCVQEYETAFLERLRAAGGKECCPGKLRERLGEMLASASPDA